ncbi:MAG: hypothetical protein ACP5SH_17155 [Syntrophobacteraceae bacterium]
MHHEEHAKHTLRIYGRRADEVHLFLDQFWEKYRISHRRLLHHRLGVELAVKKFGEAAWGPAELHILDDLGCIPETWVDHDAHVVYLEPGDEVEQEKGLVLLYGRETYDRVRSKGADS